MIELHSWPSPNGLKVAIFLEEAAVETKVIPIHIGRREQLEPDFLRISPNGRIPAIRDTAPHDGGEPVTVFESGAILLYLAEKTGKFLSRDLRERVTTLEWLFWQVGGLGPMGGQGNHFNFMAPEKISYAIDRFDAEVRRLFGVLNRRLADREFVAGDYSVADMAIYPWIVPWQTMKQNLAAHPNVAAWLGRIGARPAVQKVYDERERRYGWQPPPHSVESARTQWGLPLMAFDYDLFVIGAGSGGVRAARVSAAHGAKVAIAEDHKIGGTCVIRGCVPKKLLIFGAHFAEDLKDARRFGWDVPECAFDWPTLRDNVLAEVDRLNGLYTDTLRINKVEIFHERATVSGAHEVTLSSGRKVNAARILVATGARPHVPSFPGHDFGITSNEVFHLAALPRRILIAGAGYIANEFAGIFNELGSKVVLINRSDVILRGYDEGIRDRLLQISMTKGIEFRFNAQFQAIVRRTTGLAVSMTNHDSVEVDCVLFAAGRVPNTLGLGLERVGVELDATGAVKVDATNRSSVHSIYAVGDITNRVQLTPVAIREGQAFADSMFGNKPSSVDYSNIPSAVFSHPPIAAVGLTESEARKHFGAIAVYASDFRPMKNVLAGRNERALYKMVCDATTHRVLGLHMIGPDAPEILQAAAVGVKAGLTKEDFDQTIALHPSMAEELVLLK